MPSTEIDYQIAALACLSVRGQVDVEDIIPAILAHMRRQKIQHLTGDSRLLRFWNLPELMLDWWSDVFLQSAKRAFIQADIHRMLAKQEILSGYRLQRCGGRQFEQPCYSLSQKGRLRLQQSAEKTALS